MGDTCRKRTGHPTFCESLEFDDDTPDCIQDFETFVHLHMPHLHARVMELHEAVVAYVVQELRDYYTNPLAHAA